MKLQTEINNTKQKLINKVKRSGLYENFGQKELRKLEDKYINLGDYTDEMNENRQLLKNFDEWAQTYNG
jgi:hypothetical protein